MGRAPSPAAGPLAGSPAGGPTAPSAVQGNRPLSGVPFFRQRKAHEIPVHGTLLKLAHREHIMAMRPESSDGGEIAAFIREEAH